MKGFDSHFRIIWRTSEELSKFNKPFITKPLWKDFVLFVLAFSLFSFMGARDYVKPVSSHEAVFVGSTNFPKDLQRYNQKKPKFQGKTKN
jgi:hypothetical protein